MPLKLPAKCIVNTNVPITANRAGDPAGVPDELVACVQSCVEAITLVMQNGGLVLDAGGEIWDEYRSHLQLRGQPGLGDLFLKWVHDRQWGFPPEDKVEITRSGLSYQEFPDHKRLAGFDISDRKFIAVANAHPSKPAILQATDSKWWGYRQYLAEAGIEVKFLSTIRNEETC